MAGGTGGHLYPALAAAEEFVARGHEVSWLGVSGGMEGRVVPRHGYAIRTVDYRTPRGQGKARALATLARAVLQARRALRAAAPDVAVGMGGYTSVPGGIASWLGGIPLVIHEQNSLAGKANRLLARLARRTLAAYPGAFGRARAAAEVGNPVRRAFAEIPPPEERMRGRDGPLRLLVLGGSQGARFLNENLPGVIAAMGRPSRPEVVHQCGPGNAQQVGRAYAKLGVDADVSEFIDDMAGAMAAADLMAGRCGAATLAELSAAGLGSVLFPYPHATEGHQLANAEHFARAGAALVVEEGKFDPGATAREIAGIGRGRALEMARAARALGRAGAAGAFVDACEEAARAA